MEFDKDFIPRPYEVKAKEHVNKVCHDDEISFGFHYNECEQHHRYCGYTRGYQQAVMDMQRILTERGYRGIGFMLQDMLLYGVGL